MSDKIQNVVIRILMEEGKICGVSRGCMASRLRCRGFNVTTKNIPKIIRSLIKSGQIIEKKDMCAHQGRIWIIYPNLNETMK